MPRETYGRPRLENSCRETEADPLVSPFTVQSGFKL
jgi:hypothetical protein